MNHNDELAHDRPEDREWHLDKKVPLALIITIVAQTVAISWGASNLWTRVSELERQMQIAAPQFERIIRLELDHWPHHHSHSLERLLENRKLRE